MLKNRFFNLSYFRRILVLLFFLIFLLFFLQYFGLPYFTSITEILLILKIEFILLFSIILIISSKISGYLSVFSMFLFCSFLFNYGRIFLDFFTDFNINEGDLFSNITISDKTILELLYLIIFYLLAATLAFLIFYKKKNVVLKQNYFFVKTGKRIILTLTIPLVILTILQLKFILQVGYLAIFSGEVADFKYNSLINLVTRIVYFGYLIFLAGIPNKKDFIRISYLFLGISLIIALKGQRGAFMLLLVYIIWYYHNIYDVRFNLKKGFIITVFVLIISQIVLVVRSANTHDELSVVNIPYEFLRLNGISILIPAYLIEFKSSFVNEGVPYLFTPIYDYFYRIFVDSQIFYEGRTYDLITTSNYLSNQLIYFINRPAYYAGMGTGSSYLAEFYDFGGLFFGSFCFFILVSLIMKWEYLLFSNRTILFLSFIVVSKFIYMPRDSFFKIVNDILSLFVIFIVFTYLKKLQFKL